METSDVGDARTVGCLLETSATDWCLPKKKVTCCTGSRTREGGLPKSVGAMMPMQI